MVLMHLGLNWRSLCAPYHFMGVWLLCSSSRWPPVLYCWCPLTPKRRTPDTRVWVKPKLHIHKECGPRFHPVLFTFYTLDFLTALDCVLLKDRNLALASRQGPEINSRACLWVLPRPHHHTQCWLTRQHLILLISCLETPKAGSGPTNFRAEPPLVSSLVISFPCTPACPGTQYSPAACLVEISFIAFWHCWVNGDVLTAWRAFRAAYQSRYSCASLVYPEIEFHEHSPS